MTENKAKSKHRGLQIASITLATLSTLSIIGRLSQPPIDRYTWGQFAQLGMYGDIIGEFLGVSLFGGVATLCAYLYLRKTGKGDGVLVWSVLAWVGLIVIQSM